jgi:hypothetical protein
MTETPPNPPSTPLPRPAWLQAQLDEKGRERQKLEQEMREQQARRAEAAAVAHEPEPQPVDGVSDGVEPSGPRTSDIWLVYVPQSHPIGPLGGPSIQAVRFRMLQVPGCYRHAFAFSFDDPLICRRFKAREVMTPVMPFDGSVGAVKLTAGAPKGRGWGTGDLLLGEVHVEWRDFWGIYTGGPPTRDDLLRKIFLNMATVERCWKKLPRTIPDTKAAFNQVWDVQRLFGPWKVRE